MKTKNKMNLFSSKMKTVFISCLFSFGLIADSIGQLNSYLTKMIPNQNFYVIRQKMENYLDSLKTSIDSIYFYSGGGEFKEFKKFEKIWEPRVSPHGDFTKYFDAEYSFYMNLQDTYDYVTEAPWHELGPNVVNQSNTFKGNGPVEFLTFFDDGTPASSQFMLTGSLAGGLFYSTDYGNTWNKTGSDTKWAQSGCSWAVFHPNNHHIWYASTSGNTDGGSSWIGKTGGIWRTTDEGQNWTQIANKDTLLSIFTIIYKLVIDPQNPSILYAATSNGIFKAANCESDTVSWTRVLSGLTFDLEMKPGNDSILYSSTYVEADTAWKIMTSHNYGEHWDEMSVQPDTILTSRDSRDQCFIIEVSKAKPGYIYIDSKHSLFHSFYYYDFEASNQWNLIASHVDYKSFGNGHGFGVEQVVNGEDIIVSFSTILCKYNINSGLLHYYSTVHVDVEDVVYDPYNSNHVWACTHGGVEKSINGGLTWQPMYDGLGVAMVEKMATSYSNPEYILVGLYHDGVKLTDSEYEPNWNPTWNWIYELGVDGMKPLIDNKDPNNMWGSGQWGYWRYSNNAFNSSDTVSNFCTAYWQTIGVLNKQTPSVFFRNKFFINSINKEEVFRAIDHGLPNHNNSFISNFRGLFPNSNLINILGLYTPYNNADYLYVHLYNEDSLNHIRTWHVFLTKNANAPANEVIWEELTIPRTDTWISAIEIDPDNPDIIYLAYSSSSNENYLPFAHEMIYIIDYSNPENIDYTDISLNIPYTTARELCIAAERESNGGVYFATEFGVFYTNNEMMNVAGNEWKLVGKELPHVSSNGIEINYVSNSLRVGTWGRGVWEIPLPCIHGVQPLVIANNTNWNSFMRLNRNVKVNAGATLTINENARIAMPAGSIIIIEPGAKLILDGGILTNACEGQWQGIEVCGNPSLSQTEANQGLIEIINGGIIENALVAVRLGKTIIPEGSGEVTYGDGGGMIYATKAVFRNNKTGVVFEPYTYTNNNNVGYFTQCTFETTTVLPYNQIPQYSVMMTSVNGIDFNGCNFINALENTVPFNQRGNGIYSMNSMFQVDQESENDTINGTQYFSTQFAGLNYGIKSYGIHSNRTCSIKNTTFSNNKRGIYISAVPNVNLSSNIFRMSVNSGDGSTYDTLYAFYLDHCSGYCITENNIRSDAPLSGSRKAIGAIINQSGEANNMIYRNTFDKVYTGVLAQNENRSVSGLTGLSMKCNEFINNSYDIAITKSSIFGTSRTGIAKYQGANLPQPDGPAGNLFSWTGPSGTPTDINNQTQHITYYYHISLSVPLKPNFYTPLTVAPFAVTGAIWNEESCPPLFEGDFDEFELREEVAKAEQQADSLRIILALLEDGGNTDDLKQYLATSIPAESMQVYTELMSTSPYLTDTIIGAAIEKENVLFDAMIRDVMVANPQSSKDDGLIEKIGNRATPLPDYMMGQILQGRSLVSVYEQLQSKLAYYSQKQANAFHKLVIKYLTDTINPSASTDSLVLLLTTMASPEAKYELAFLHIEQGNINQEFAVLNEIPLQFGLTTEQQAEHQKLVDFCNLMTELNGAIPDSVQTAGLQNIQMQQSGIASAFARNYLLSLNKTVYSEPILLPDMLKSSEEIRYEQMMHPIGKDKKHIEVFPNPAKDNVILSWKLDMVTFSGKMIVTDNSGKLISEIPVKTAEDKYVFDTRKMIPGVYIVTLYNNINMIESTKFTLIK